MLQKAIFVAAWFLVVSSGGACAAPAPQSLVVSPVEPARAAVLASPEETGSRALSHDPWKLIGAERIERSRQLVLGPSLGDRVRVRGADGGWAAVDAGRPRPLSAYPTLGHLVPEDEELGPGVHDLWFFRDEGAFVVVDGLCFELQAHAVAPCGRASGRDELCFLMEPAGTYYGASSRSFRGVHLRDGQFEPVVFRAKVDGIWFEKTALPGEIWSLALPMGDTWVELDCGVAGRVTRQVSVNEENTETP